MAAQTGTTSAPSSAASADDLIQDRIVDEAVFGDVGDVEGRLGREQEEIADLAQRLRLQAHRADRLAGVELIADLLEQALRARIFLSPVLAMRSARSRAFSTESRSARASSVLMTSMSLQRIDASGDMHHVVVLETAHHMGDGIGLADVGEELVAEPLALGRTGHQTRRCPRTAWWSAEFSGV
jgi:hypothetical protein